MRVWITGGDGQLGRALRTHAPDDVEVLATGRNFDVADFMAMSAVAIDFAPDVVINAAAYTAVDQAESDSERAWAVNHVGVLNLARLCAEQRARLVHISTDYVFDGSLPRPLLPDDAVNPLNVYGASKAAGEQAAFAELGDEATVVRTSWVYAAHGRNFVHTMLRLMRERSEVRVVADQIGVPTSALSLSRCVWAVIASDRRRTLHYTDAGVASWYDFAVAIAEEGAAVGLLSGAERVVPIATREFPTAARRPAFSVLDARTGWSALGRPANHWRSELRAVLVELAERATSTQG